MAIKLLLSLCLFATLAAIVPAPPVDKEQDLRKFLKQYGYWNGNDNKDFRKAVREFQRNYGLEETGEYSESMKKFIYGQRCGNKDVHKPGNGPDNYELFAPWSKTSLKYEYLNILRKGIDLSATKVKATVADGFQLWADAVSGRLQFAEAGRKEASDVFIGFYKGSHIDPYAFDGPSGVLAHAFYPEVGHLHYDADEAWSGNYVNGINLESVTIHEIGHILGLRHSNITGSIMFPYYSQPSGPVSLHQDDIDGINALYPPPA